MNVVIYARYSSEKQDEASIEGQLKSCRDFIVRNGYTEVRTPYIDRAMTGTSDKRDNFQQMIADSKSGAFQGIIVYKFDRFTRSRKHSIIYKELLRKNGVRVISVNETVGDDPNGFIIEGFHELFAEWFIVNLSSNIRRGMDLNASKCLATGGNMALGYKVCKETKKYLIDETTAPAVVKIFEMYASGSTMADISRYLNAHGVKTRSGVFFNKNSLQSVLKNRRYLGIYTYKGNETVGGMPRIIEDDLFYRVQEQMERNKKNFGGTRSKQDFLLTHKLQCGHCGAFMVGDGGTSRNGTKYHYYSCKNAKVKKCGKTWVTKRVIEDAIVKASRQVIQTDEGIDLIAQKIVAAYQDGNNVNILENLEKKLGDNERSIKNLLLIVEKGGDFKDIKNRLDELKTEKEMLKQEIEVEQKALALTEMATEPHIKFFLKSLRKGDAQNDKDRKGLIAIFVNRADLYNDGKCRLFLNVSDIPVEITLEIHAEMLEKEKTAQGGSSEVAMVVAPRFELGTSGL